MAENDDTPDSREPLCSRADSQANDSDSTNNNAPRSSAVKDRACPFCHQSFTSSSLGRHLDTYIRAKNPKAPDGVHDVAEIRKIRGNITRRHARASSAADPASKRASSEAQQRALPNGATPPQPVQPSVQPQPPMHPTYMNDSARAVFRTKADWTATGVINNLPPRSSTTPNSRDLPLPRPDYPPSDRQLLDESEERDHARAMELALKEVLNNVQDAVTRAKRPPIFDFDPLTFNFPALCLRVLSPPTTLFSATPTANDGSWPVELPSQSTYETLRSTVAERIKVHQQPEWTGPNGSSSKDDSRESRGRQELPRELQAYMDHIDNTYSHWTQLSETRKQEVWDVELMRAYADEVRQGKALDQQLEDAYREVTHLRAQIEAINRQQPWQRSRSPHASYPNPTPAMLPRKVAREMADANIDMREWDFDRLVSKWKHSVRPRRNWAWTNAPPPPSAARTGSQDVRPPSNPGSFSRAYGQTSESMQPTSQNNTSAPQYNSPMAMESGSAPISSIEGQVVASPDNQDSGAPSSDVEMKDQEPSQSRRSRRMFAREGAG